MNREPQIALIGTEGSGKTVLAVCLAKKLETIQGGVWLEPRGAKTQKYLASSWSTLCQGEWVPSTPAGTLFELKWQMWAGERNCHMKMIDSAGQDLRRLFSDDVFEDPNLADQDRQYIEYVQNSTILLVLINMTDFLGEPDPMKVIENGATLKRILDYLQASQQERQIAFVFTAYDLFEATIQSRFGSAEEFIKQKIPYLYNAYVANTPVKCFCVAAVADTEIKTENDGTTRRVPAYNFSSKGFEPLVDWLADAIQTDIVRQEEEKIRLDAEEFAARQRELATLEEEQRVQRRQEITKNAWNVGQKVLFFWVIVFVVSYILGGVISCRKETQKALALKIEAEQKRIEAERLKQPRPELMPYFEQKGYENGWKDYYTCSTGLFDCWEHRATANALIRNTGGPGNIIVTYTTHGKSQSKTEFFNTNEAKWISITVYDLPNHGSVAGQIDYKAAGQ